MAAATIIHVGTDTCHRISVLKTIGYAVMDCTSFAQFHAALTGVPSADAVAIAESSRQLSQKATLLTRATVSIPLILFQSDATHLDESDFDLVVPSLSPPQIWIAEIEQLVQESRALRAHSEMIREESKLLRRMTALNRADARSLVEKSRLELLRSEFETARNRKL